MKTKNILGFCSAAALALATSVQATPNQDAIRYSTDGSTWTTVTDSDGDGVIALINVTVGGFTFTAVSTQTYPFIGNPATPNMDLNIQGKAVGPGTLYVEFTTIDFSPIPNGHYVTTEALADGPAVTASETTRIGTPPNQNTPFDTGVNATTIGGLASGNFTSSLGSPVAGQVAPYSITLQVVFTSTDTSVPGQSAQGSGTSISSDTHLNTVPDGGNTLMLLGSALSVLGFGAFRKSRKA